MSAGSGEDPPQPEPGGRRPAPDKADHPRAEAVLSQALRVMAGGPKRHAPAADGADGADGADATPAAAGGSSLREWLARLTTPQMLLMAAIVGLLIGMVAGFAVVLT